MEAAGLLLEDVPVAVLREVLVPVGILRPAAASKLSVGNAVSEGNEA